MELHRACPSAPGSVFFSEIEQVGPRLETPVSPRRDHLDVGIERIGGQFKAYLVVALASGAVSDGVGAGFLGDLDQPFGNQRPGNRCAQQIDAFIDGIGAEHRENEIADEFLAQIIDIDFLDAQHLGLAARRFELLALAKVGGKGHDLAFELGLQPFQND